MTPPRPLLENFLGVMSGLSLGTRMSNLNSVALTVFELSAFNSHDRPLRTHKQTNKHTDKHTHIERTHYLRHSLRSLGGDNNVCLNSKASEEIRSESTENCRFRQCHCRLTPPFQGTPANIRINLTLSETRFIELHRCD